MTTLDAYRYVAAMSTLDKWMILSEYSIPRYKLDCKLKGLIWHDRYLCGDAEKGRAWGGARS